MFSLIYPRRLFLLLVTFLTLSSATMACDICGCGGSNIYMGLLPNFKSKFIGVRYHYSHFHTVLASDQTQFSNNYYNTIELWGGWNIGKKWQVLAFVPYYVNKQM
ncbi:MAG TPA: transporter, partial [Puia sp.]|nr:transporter [Puia sp.]